jgi:hypothetical protein
MANDSTEALDDVFLALSDRARRAMVDRLAQGEASGTELARRGDHTMPTSIPDTIEQTPTTGSRPTRWWLAYGAVVLAIITSAAFGVLSLVAPTAFLSMVGVRTAHMDVSAQVFAAYTGARELAIAGTLLVLLVMRATRGLAAVMLLAALANGFDVGHALLSQRWAQLPGALLFAILYLAAAIWLFNRR